MKPIITIYSDGACRGNPGDGGWGALLISGTNEKSICGGERNTTNNRMELLAVIKALEIIKQSSEIQIYTDSTYVQKGITEWIHNWKRNHWKNSSKKIINKKILIETGSGTKSRYAAKLSPTPLRKCSAI